MTLFAPELARAPDDAPWSWANVRVAENEYTPMVLRYADGAWQRVEVPEVEKAGRLITFGGGLSSRATLGVGLAAGPRIESAHRGRKWP